MIHAEFELIARGLSKRFSEHSARMASRPAASTRHATRHTSEALDKLMVLGAWRRGD